MLWTYEIVEIKIFLIFIKRGIIKCKDRYFFVALQTQLYKQVKPYEVAGKKTNFITV